MSLSAEHAGVACLSNELLRDFWSGRIRDSSLEEQLSDHLASCETCASRLERLPPDPLVELLSAGDTLRPWIDSGTPLSAHSLSSTDSLRAGDSEPTDYHRLLRSLDGFEPLPVKIGEYFVIRQLGEGGFGTVYLARDPQSERLVAIKSPRRDRFPSRASRAAFLKEARTAAEFDHDHIVSVHDCCELDDGRCIVVMEYIEGETLREAKRGARLSQAQGVRIVARIAEALDYAHQRGVVHRDVKPANILLDREGTPYLTDFGLAVRAEEQHLLRGDLAGTYPYMSPEQIVGNAGELDGRSDVWSLGVVLYELLTGTRPFCGSTYEEVKKEILSGEVQAPRCHDPLVDPALESVCLKCLRRNPAERFATAGELAQQLDKAVSRRPRRWLAIGATAAVVCIAAIAAWSVISSGARGNWRPVKALGLNQLAWDVVANDDYFQKLEPSGIVVKSSAARSCFETHHPVAKRYRLQTTGTFQDEIGYAGIVVGIYPTRVTPQHYRCMAVYISRNLPDPGIWLWVEESQIEIGPMKLQPGQTLLHVRLDPQPRSDFDLKIEVDRERIVSLSYNGRRITEAEQALRTHQIPSKTSCGIYAMGHVVFHTLHCEERADE